jgi:outer membrane protein assembly factor BamB
MVWFKQSTMKPHLLLFALFASPLFLNAGDWPQFRGPNRDGVSTETNVPLTWSATENMKWKLDLPGPGSSSPIVTSGKVIVTCFSGNKDDGDVSGLVRHVVCVDKATGKKLWQKDYPATHPDDPSRGMIMEHGYTSNTPATDGEHIYVHWGKGGVVALDMDGKELWKADTGTESNRMHWGSGGSVLLWKNLVIVNAADEAQALIAFDKTTGKQVWKQAASALEMAFSSPRLFQQADGREDLVFAASGELWGMNPATGKLRWFAAHGLQGNVAPDPVQAGDVFCIFGGYPQTGRVAVKAGVTGEVSESNVVWRDNNSSYIPTPVLHDGKLYVINDQGFAWCADVKTGNMLYRERAIETGGTPPDNGGGPAGRPPGGGGGPGGPGGGGRRGGGGKPFYASPIVIGDKIVDVSRKQGTFIYPAKPQFDKPTIYVIAGDTTDFNATPAVSDGCLFLRSNKALYCVGK